MPILPAILLAAFLLVMAWLVRQDQAEYAAFRALTDTAARQARYRSWLVKNLAIFTGGGVVILALLGRLPAIAVEPQAFAGLTAKARIATPDLPMLLGIGVGAFFGLGLSVFIAMRKAKPRPRVIGDVI